MLEESFMDAQLLTLCLEFALYARGRLEKK